MTIVKTRACSELRKRAIIVRHMSTEHQTMAERNITSTLYEYQITSKSPLVVAVVPLSSLEGRRGGSCGGIGDGGSSATEAFEAGAHFGFISCFLLIVGCGVVLSLCERNMSGRM